MDSLTEIYKLLLDIVNVSLTSKSVTMMTGGKVPEV